MHVNAIQPYQIIIMVVFLMLLMVALFLVRRFRGGLSKHIQRTKRLRHVEDMILSPNQKLHLVEVDGKTFMIHSGKGHAATVVGVGNAIENESALTPEEPMMLVDIQKPLSKPTSAKSKKPVSPTEAAVPSASKSVDRNRSNTNIDQITSAIAEARRRNPSLGLGK